MPSTTHIRKLHKFLTLEKCNTEYNLKLKMFVLWDFISCRVVNRYQHFRGACTLRLQNSYRKIHFSWATLKAEAACTTATLPPLFLGYPEEASTVSVHQSMRRHIQQDGSFITGVTSSHLPRFTVTKRNNRRLDNIVSCE